MSVTLVVQARMLRLDGDNPQWVELCMYGWDLCIISGILLFLKEPWSF